jgi:hypothetical protein
LIRVAGEALALADGQAPKADRMIGARRDGGPAVGSEIDLVYGPGMAAQADTLAARVDIPQAHGTVSRPGENVPAIAGKHGGIHALGMAREQANEIAGWNFPESQGEFFESSVVGTESPITAAGNRESAIG